VRPRGARKGGTRVAQGIPQAPGLVSVHRTARGLNCVYPKGRKGRRPDLDWKPHQLVSVAKIRVDQRPRRNLFRIISS